MDTTIEARRWDIKFSRKYIIFMACIVELFFADIAPFSNWDGLLVGVVMAVALPYLAPYLLVIISTLQDAPGISGVGWYVGFTIVGLLVIFAGWNAYLFKSRKKYIIDLLFISLAVVIYAIFSSLIQQWLGYPQAASRLPILVGGLMLFMIFVGISICSMFENEKKDIVVTFLCLVLGHSVIVSLLQTIDPTFFHSVAGIIEINKSQQLSIATAFGFPRITGTYLTPNGWAYCNILLLLLALRLHYVGADITRKGLLVFFVVSIFFATMAFSKALLIFVLLSSCLMYWQIKRLEALVVGVAVWTFGMISFYTIDFSALASAFRLDKVSYDSYRYEMWYAILSQFDLQDWLFGVGLGYWPIFFQTYLGIPESDPHSILLSIPGTFGVLGVFLYAFLLVALIRLYVTGSGFNKSLTLILFILFFVKDIISYPYFLGNTPLTALIWALLFLAGKNEDQRV